MFLELRKCEKCEKKLPVNNFNQFLSKNSVYLDWCEACIEIHVLPKAIDNFVKLRCKQDLENINVRKMTKN